MNSLDEEYIKRKLKWFDERPKLVSQREKFEKDILEPLQAQGHFKERLASSAEVKDEIDSGHREHDGNLIVLFLTKKDEQKEKIVNSIVCEHGVDIEIAYLKDLAKYKTSVSTFPSVSFLRKGREINKTNQINKKELENIANNVFAIRETTEATSYTDANDKKQLAWGGTRSSSRVNPHVLSSTPMFFRRNGMMFDIVNMYEGDAVFLICNGPSFKQVNKDLLKLPGVLTFGINNGAHVFRPNIWTCVDDPTRFMRSIWEDPTIMKVVPQAHFEKRLYDKKEDIVIDKVVGECANVAGFRRNELFDPEKFFYEDTINWGNHKDHGGGRSVMVSSLRICHLLGFKRVYLLGCDFNMSTENKYFFEEKREGSAISGNNSSYKKMMKYFEDLQPYMDDVDFKVYNTNKDSALRCFEFIELEEAITNEVIDTSESTDGMYMDPKKKNGFKKN